MKIAKIVPIPKQGDPELCTNYRPISLLTGFSKILEKLVHARTVSFLRDNEILNNSQFGFRENCNTTHAILSLINQVNLSIDKKLHTIGIFLDFSKAFDTVNHDILLHKLSHYGIRGKALEWFESYLSNRTQYVCLNNIKSQSRKVECGVPQGSVLGPLLFVIYVNDFYKSSSKLSFILYADDSNLFASHKDPQTLLNTVNTELKSVYNWIKANKLSLNLSKTNYMLFSNTINNLPGPITINNTDINKVQSMKFLGVHIDCKLSWKNHINQMCKVISRNIGVINRLKWTLPPKILLSLYSTLVLPHLTYGILAWGNSPQYLMDRVLLLQKKAMRVINHSSYNSSTDSLFKVNHVLKVQDIYRLSLATFMFQYHNNSLPHAFHGMFKTNNEMHKYPTRSSTSFHLPLTRTLLVKDSFLFSGPKLWNSLPKELTSVATIYTFKRKLKTSLISLYNN